MVMLKKVKLSDLTEDQRKERLSDFFNRSDEERAIAAAINKEVHKILDNRSK